MFELSGLVKKNGEGKLEGEPLGELQLVVHPRLEAKPPEGQVCDDDKLGVHTGIPL